MSFGCKPLQCCGGNVGALCLLAKMMNNNELVAAATCQLHCRAVLVLHTHFWTKQQGFVMATASWQCQEKAPEYKQQFTGVAVMTVLVASAVVAIASHKSNC